MSYLIDPETIELLAEIMFYPEVLQKLEEKNKRPDIKNLLRLYKECVLAKAQQS